MSITHYWAADLGRAAGHLQDAAALLDTIERYEPALAQTVTDDAPALLAIAERMNVLQSALEQKED